MSGIFEEIHRTGCHSINSLLDIFDSDCGFSPTLEEDMRQLMRLTMAIAMKDIQAHEQQHPTTNHKWYPHLLDWIWSNHSRAVRKKLFWSRWHSQHNPRMQLHIIRNWSVHVQPWITNHTRSLARYSLTPTSSSSRPSMWKTNWISTTAKTTPRPETTDRRADNLALQTCRDQERTSAWR